MVGYGSEAWNFSSTVNEKINAMEMWCYRRILKISWEEMISDEKVLDIIGKRKSLLQDLIRRKMRFAGHIMRGSSGLLPRLVLEGMIEEKRDRGRQGRTWGDDVKEWSGCQSIGSAKRMYGDKRRWRVMVTNLLIEDGT